MKTENVYLGHRNINDLTLSQLLSVAWAMEINLDGLNKKNKIQVKERVEKRLKLK